MFWNEGQRGLIGPAFIPENKPPIKFADCGWPSTINVGGDAYRKCGDIAIRLETGEIVQMDPNQLVHCQTNIKSVWQDAFGPGSR